MKLGNMCTPCPYDAEDAAIGKSATASDFREADPPMKRGRLIPLELDPGNIDRGGR
jgi:hypothetical protein